MKRDEIWKVAIPFAPGHAQAGERPAVIVQDDPFIVTLPTVSIVPFTGSQSATRFPGTVRVQPDGQNGLTGTFVALVFQMRALDRRHCLRRLGELDVATLDQLFTELDKLTGR